MVRELLEKNNKLFMLSPPQPRDILPKNSYAVYRKVIQAIGNKEKILIVPDPDVDGIHSAKAWDFTFRKIGYRNFSVVPLERRQHTVKYRNIEKYLDAGFTTIIIVDSSSGNLELIKKICAYSDRISLIIVDHHECKNYSHVYNKNCIVVNPKLENPELPYRMWSAGLINAEICKYILYKLKYNNVRELDVFGYASMYSDKCPIDNPYSVALMTRCISTDCIPSQIKNFMNDYTAINRTFIDFTYSPIINAVMRMDRFDLIHKYFFEYENIHDVASIIEEMKDCHKQAKEVLNELICGINNNSENEDDYDEYEDEDDYDDGILTNIQEENEVVIGILPSNLPQHYYNFMGLVATKLAQKYNKVALCVWYNSDIDCYIVCQRLCK